MRTFIDTSGARGDRARTLEQRLDQLDAKDAHEPRHGPLDDLGFGMPDDDIAVALVATAVRLARARQPRLDDERCHVLRLVESVDRAHLALALAAQIRRAHGVLPRRGLEFVVDYDARPGTVEIEVVGVRDQRRELGTR